MDDDVEDDVNIGSVGCDPRARRRLRLSPDSDDDDDDDQDLLEVSGAEKTQGSIEDEGARQCGRRDFALFDDAEEEDLPGLTPNSSSDGEADYATMLDDSDDDGYVMVVEPDDALDRLDSLPAPLLRAPVACRPPTPHPRRACMPVFATPRMTLQHRYATVMSPLRMCAGPLALSRSPGHRSEEQEARQASAAVGTELAPAPGHGWTRSREPFAVGLLRKRGGSDGNHIWREQIDGLDG